MTATDSSPTAPAGRAAESLPAPVEAGTGEYRRISWALFAAGVATFSLLYATQAVLPQITGEFGVTASAASLSVSVATGALALAVLPMATLSEAVGRRTTMVASLAVATGLGVLIPLSPNLAVLLVLRGLQGIALAGLPATAMAYLGEEMSGRALAGAMGLYVAGNSIGGMTGRLIAGLVADVAGLRAGMWADAALALACTALIVGLLPRSRRFVAQPLALRPLGAGVLAALRDPALRSLYAVAALLMGCFVGVYNFLGFRLLDDPFTVAPAVVALLFTAYAVGSVTSPLAGRLAGRCGRPRVLLGAVALTAVGVLAMTSGHLSLILLGLVVLTGSFFAAHATASGWVAARASGRARAQASGLYLLAYYGGSSIGGWAAGPAFAAGGWPAVSVLTLLLLALAGLAALHVAHLTRTPA